MRDDKELIKRWKEKKDYAAYNTLKNRHRGMVHQMKNRYSASSVPNQALEAEAWKLFDDAVDNYKDDKGAKFSTYLNYQLRKLDRYTKKYQNVARIPEALSGKIGDYDRSYEKLKKQQGTEPTHKDMANALDMPVRHIKQLHKSRRQDLFEGMYEGVTEEPDDLDEKTDWLLIEVRDELTQQEREVYDHLIGYQKPKITNKKELANKMGLSAGRISQITSNIQRKIKPHLNRL